MKTRLFSSVAPTVLGAALLAGCSTVTDTQMASASDMMESETAQETAAPQATGYFAKASTLPLQAPDFTKVSDDDYLPAFEQAMELHNVEIAAIRDNPAAPTFENTIVALETSGKQLGRVATMFFALTGANTNDTLDAVQAEVGPKLSAHSDAITLDPVLFARVKAVYDNRAAMTMEPEDAVLLEETYKGMVQAGAMLTDAQKTEVRAINTRLSEVTTEFGQRVRAATVDNALIVDTREELAGLSDSEIDAAAKLAADKDMPGKFAIALQNTTQQPSLPSLENRAVREKLFTLSHDRAVMGDDNDTRALIAEIASLRAQKAALFGQPDWASYVMYDRMAKNPKTALDFMEQMVPALAATQRREAALLNAKIEDEGGDFEVKPWDWYRYAEMVRKETVRPRRKRGEAVFRADDRTGRRRLLRRQQAVRPDVQAAHRSAGLSPDSDDL